MTGLVGRSRELQLLAPLPGATREHESRVVWVEGVAGSGKSALLKPALLLEPGPRLWVASGDVEEELVDGGVVDQLLRQAAPGGAATQSMTALTDAVLEAGSGPEPVLLVIDDAQWCDAMSLRALRHLLRRLPRTGVAVVISHEPMGAWPEDTRRACAHVRHDIVRLAGLSVNEVRMLLSDQGKPLTPRAGQRLHAHTGGLPGLLLTLAAELSHEDLVAGDGPLTAPHAYARWVGDALREAAEETRAIVGALAVMGGPQTPAAITAMTGLVHPEPHLDEAVRLGLVTSVTTGDDRRVDLSDPLVRSAVIETLPFSELATLHTRASGLSQDRVRGLLHRLYACTAADVRLAQEVREQADRCAESGAVLTSAALLIALGGRSVDPRTRCDLWVLAAERLLTVGEVRWAEKLLTDVSRERPGPGPPEEQLVAGHLNLHLGRGPEARGLALEAWEHGRDPRVVAGAAELLAYLAMDVGDGVEATTWAVRAIEAADTRLVQLQWAGVVLASGWALRGDLAPADDVLDLHRARLAGTGSEPDLRLGRALIRLWSGDLQAADEELQGLERLGPSSSVLRSTARLCQAELDYRRGRWDEVAEVIGHELALIDEGWDSHTAPMVLSVGAYACAGRSEVEMAGQLIGRAAVALEPHANLPARVMVALAQAHLAAAQGSAGEVIEALRPLWTNAATRQIPEGVHPWRALLAAALVDGGRPSEAREVLDDDAIHTDDPYAMSGILRSGARLAVALDEQAEAEELLVRAVALGAPRSGIVQHARASYELGALLRRDGRRRHAAHHLEAARQTFADVGAVDLMAKAERELDLCALKRTTALGQGLTPAEDTVARLAVEGNTNKEIAGLLSVSIKTVETHLGRVFTKLGVRHRVELVGAMAGRDASHRPRRLP